MGHDVKFFPVKPHPEFICSICHGVFKDPAEVSTCQHIFCRPCIVDYIKTNAVCPKDRRKVTKSSLREPDRFFKQLYSELQIRCNDKDCSTVVILEQLEEHMLESHASIEHWKALADEKDAEIREQAQIIEQLRTELDKSEKDKKDLNEKLTQRLETSKKEAESLKDQLSKCKSDKVHSGQTQGEGVRVLQVQIQEPHDSVPGERKESTQKYKVVSDPPPPPPATFNTRLRNALRRVFKGGKKEQGQKAVKETKTKPVKEPKDKPVKVQKEKPVKEKKQKGAKEKKEAQQRL